ncbi:MAG: electron transfer flavoprotein subunit alpha/FixB family protein [Fervidicoccus sp.]|nr:MAG: electron transfer flavoprotein subunit alpha/FixB family protein [Fervidicoccus sp.]
MSEEYKGIMVYAEVHNGTIHPVTFELLGKARELANKKGTKVLAALAGYGVKEKAQELIYRGADIVYVTDSEKLKTLDVVAHKSALLKIIEKAKPEAVLIGATNTGRTLAPRVSAYLKTGLTADCTDLFIDDNGNLVQVRPAFSGNIFAHILTKTKPVMSTVRYRTFKPADRDQSRKGEVIDVEMDEIGETGYRVLRKMEREKVNISEAELIISAGRGLKKKEDLEMIRELASLLGATVGASRPLVDDDWISRDHQVGFSGNIVKPKVYIAIGISGSPQHVVGMKDSGTVISINIDPSAPIGEYSDYMIVGDLYEVIPKLIEEIKKLKSQKP